MNQSAGIIQYNLEPKTQMQTQTYLYTVLNGPTVGTELTNKAEASECDVENK